MSVNIDELKTPVQLSIIPGSYVSCFYMGEGYSFGVFFAVTHSRVLLVKMHGYTTCIKVCMFGTVPHQQQLVDLNCMY